MKVPRVLNRTVEVIGQCINTGTQGPITEEHQKVLHTCRINIMFYIVLTVNNVNN